MDSTLILPLLALAVAVGALYVAARRAVTIAELDIERGIIRVVRLQVRILRSPGRAEVQLIGSVTDHQAQQIRNVIGRVPLARLVNAPKSKPRR